LNRSLAASLGAIALALTCASVSAHEVIVDQVVDVALEARASQLLVRVRVPATVLGDANLPRMSDRTIDVEKSERLLGGVGADIARNLDIEQGDVALAAPAVVARFGSDRRSVDVTLTYSFSGDASGFSARLNAFHAVEGPARTNVRFTVFPGESSGVGRDDTARVQTLTVVGPATRVQFDPGALDTSQQFAGRGLRAVLDGGDHLLFLLCLLLPVLAGRQALMLFAAMATGQLIAIGASLPGPGLQSDTQTMAAMIAASMVVMAALQNVVRARRSWVMALAFVFGVSNGLTLGGALGAAVAFGGVHTWMAVSAFVLVVFATEIWLGGLAWGTRVWLDERGAPACLVSVLGSVLIAHSAVHRVVDRGQLLARSGAFGGERAIVWLSIAWATVMLCVALYKALSVGAADVNDGGAAILRRGRPSGRPAGTATS
jgi:hypothetical protein